MAAERSQRVLFYHRFTACPSPYSWQGPAHYRRNPLIVNKTFLSCNRGEQPVSINMTIVTIAKSPRSFQQRGQSKLNCEVLHKAEQKISTAYLCKSIEPNRNPVTDNGFISLNTYVIFEYVCSQCKGLTL